jgi:hypothetical protein
MARILRIHGRAIEGDLRLGMTSVYMPVQDLLSRCSLGLFQWRGALASMFRDLDLSG